jgi:hypothetical protein
MPKSTMTAGGSTGSAEPEARKVLTCPFDIYEIKVALTPAGRFLGILEVKTRRDFVSPAQLASQRCSVDVDGFYRGKP